MRIRLVVALALSILAMPLFAQSQSNNDIGLWYSTDKVSSTTSDTAMVSFKKAHGYGLSLNHFWASHLSTELAYSRLHNDGTLTVGGQNVLDIGRLTTKIATGILQWHFMRSGTIDPYIGGGFAYVKSDDLSSSDLTIARIGSVPIEKKWGWAANGGLNYHIGRNLGLAVDYKYIPYKPNSGSGANALKLKLNPAVLSAGLKLRF